MAWRIEVSRFDSRSCDARRSVGRRAARIGEFVDGDVALFPVRPVSTTLTATWALRPAGDAVGTTFDCTGTAGWGTSTAGSA